jgi:beta-glucosidase
MQSVPPAHALAISVLLLLSTTACVKKETSRAAYRNPELPVEQRVTDLLSRMTAEEKVAMLSGANWMETAPIERLGIPAIKMADGPMGVRAWYGPSALTNAARTTLPKINATAFPVGMAMAATWNPDLVEKEGRVIAQETRTLGRNMILAPTVNIARIPLWGRNFEGYGEDPFLAARMAVAYVRGVQSEGVIATAKHFAANNQEFERHRIDEKIDERTLQEIYFPAFKAAVQEAGVLSVMSAYNKVNGAYCAENPYLLDEVLRKQWGFKGFVISDWGGTYSTADTLRAGLNLEMPGGKQMLDWLNTPKPQQEGNSGGWLVPQNVMPALKSNQISQALLDERVRSLLRTMFKAGLFDNRPRAVAMDASEVRSLARAAAAESIVLLKNLRHTLPYSSSTLHSIAVIGPNAPVARTGGGGSSQVRPAYTVAPLDGIRAQAGAQLRVDFALGVAMEGETPDATAESSKAMRKEAAALAAKADAAVVIVGYAPALESEGFDRKSLDLPAGQNELIQAVAEANRNTVVVIQAGSPVAMSKWLARVPAVLQAWYGGQEVGNAIADVLFGRVNPSGKLPVTFPKEMKDTPAFGFYPGENLRTDYGEGIYVGYRHYDGKRIAPLFPFGFGLSYTNFEYSDLTVPQTAGPAASIQVTLNIRNAGPRAGAEVVQLYMHDAESSVDRPLRELKAFRKVYLEQGESQRIDLSINKSALSFFSPAKRDWVVEPGLFEALVGSSSRDIRLKRTFQLQP